MRLPRHGRQRGFTLLEVLVALVIVGTALGASLRAVGSLTQNSDGLRSAMMATWSAENHLVRLRLAGGKGLPSHVGANTHKRAEKWQRHYPEFGLPAAWDWDAVARHERRLIRVLKKAVAQDAAGQIQGHA